MLGLGNNKLRWLLLAWLLTTLWISPTRVMHAHEGGEVSHSLLAHHDGPCSQGTHLPGRHAHFMLFGIEVHVPLSEHDAPPGVAADEARQSPQEQSVFGIWELLQDADLDSSTPLPVVGVDNGPLQTILIGATNCAPSGLQCRILFSSLTL